MTRPERLFGLGCGGGFWCLVWDSDAGAAGFAADGFAPGDFWDREDDAAGEFRAHDFDGSGGHALPSK